MCVWGEGRGGWVGVDVAQSLVFFVVFCRSLLLPFISFGLWLFFWYLQTLTYTIITKAKTNGRDKLVSWAQISPWPGDASILHTRWKCHLSEWRCCTEHWVFLLNFIHKTHKLLYVLKRYDGFYHHLNIRQYTWRSEQIRKLLTTFNLIIPNTICVTNIMTFSLLFISTWQ